MRHGQRRDVRFRDSRSSSVHGRKVAPERKQDVRRSVLENVVRCIQRGPLPAWVRAQVEAWALAGQEWLRRRPARLVHRVAVPGSGTFLVV